MKINNEVLPKALVVMKSVLLILYPYDSHILLHKKQQTKYKNDMLSRRFNFSCLGLEQRKKVGIGARVKTNDENYNNN